MKSWIRVATILPALCFALVPTRAQTPVAAAAQSPPQSSQRQFLDRYCSTCHNDRLKTGDLSLERIDVSKPDAQPEIWEKVVRKLRTGVMPPPNMGEDSVAVDSRIPQISTRR